MAVDATPTTGTLGETGGRELAGFEPPRDELEAGRVFASLHERMFGKAERVTIGRFEVTRRLGAGAMGVVYAARDPQLDREVAVKVLRGEKRNTNAAARLLREAKALARLRHPHVVTVLEIGTHDDGLFIAMDLVEGRTLREWLRDEPPWQRIVEVFLQAGQGLAAAHAADLVHRDFKPDNVLVDDAGRAKVVDFGLARAGVPMDATPEADLEVTEPGDMELTRTGALVGTPAYMAPEGFGGRSDARSDQFGYCAALYEALYGVRPFTGRNVLELLEAIERGRLEKPLRSRSVPSWLRRIIVRGLAADPSKRFESMEALLATIEGRKRRRSQAIAVGTGLSGLVLGAFAISTSLFAQEDRCKYAALAMHDVWNDAERASAREALVATQLGYAEETWRRVEAELDAYVDGWAAMRKQSCTATLRGEQSDSLHDLRMTCLDRRLQAVRSVLELFTTADEELLSGAVEAVRGLPALESCADEEGLREAERRRPAPAALQARIVSLYERIDAARVRKDAGRYGPALVEAEAIAEEAMADAVHDVAARAYLLVAELQDKLEDPESAALAARHAVWAADAAADDEVRAEATARLVALEGKQHDIAAGHAWARTTRALLERLGEPIRIQAELAENEATLLHHAGRLAESVERRREAIALQSEVLSHDDLKLAATHFNLANTLADLGRSEEALEAFERVLAIRISALGSRHPSVARAHNRIAAVLTDQGRFSDATEHLEQAIEIGTESLGSEHSFIADALVHLGNVVAQGTDPVASLPHYERGIAILEANRGDRDVRVAHALNNYGRVLWGTGRLEQALPVLERSLSIQEEVLEADHGSLMYVLNNLSQVLLGLERYGEALAAAERGLAVAIAQVGEDHAMVVHLLLALGEIHLASDAPALAIAPLERAIASHDRAEVRRAERGPVAFRLAEALWATGERERAIEHARSAIEDFRSEGDLHAVWIREITHWLQERGVEPATQSDR